MPKTAAKGKEGAVAKPKAASTGKKAAPAKAGTKAAQPVVPARNPLIEKRVLNRGIGRLSRKRDLYRFVKWPKYIQLQRKRRILYLRLKVPPAIAQFTRTLDKATAFQVFKLLSKYRPEERSVRVKRLAEIAKGRLQARESKTPFTAPPKRIKNVVHGIRQVTALVESKRAKLVVIAHDVDPVDIVVWLPALCRKLDIPYVIVKGKARLGALVYKKNTSVVAVAEVNKEDAKDLGNLVAQARQSFNENVEARRQWGGMTLGNKAKAALAKHQKILAKELNVRQKAAVK